MKRFLPILSLFLLILMPGCEVVDPVSTPEAPPVLSRPAVPDTLRLGDAAGMRISVRVSDPQSIGDAGSVRFAVFLEGNPVPVFEDTLRDDGTGGDILPRDGEHTGRISGADIGGRAGRYRVGFLAVPQAGDVLDTLFAGFHAVEGASGSAPVIFEVNVPDSLSKEDLGSVRFSVRTEDPDGAEDIDSVFCDVYPPFQPQPAVRLGLAKSPGNGQPQYAEFGYDGDLNGVIAISGSYTFRFQARDRAGLLSLPRVAIVAITLPNQPPVLSEPSVPDTVSRRNSDPILLSVRATDPQGPADIRRVYFNTIKPDGAPSAGNPFSLYDDGTNGDVTAADGVYSRAIMISTSNMLGDYRFDFYAEDLAGEVSGALTRIITVTDQIPE